jgi:hypothetical protein
MKSVHWRSTAACCYTIGLTISAVGTGCLGDGNLHDGEDSVSSAIVLDTTSSYAFVGVQSGKCIQPVNQSTASNARVEISTCTGAAIQRFQPQATGRGFFQLQNELTGLCLDVSLGSAADGASVVQFPCNGGPNQQWSFTDVAGGAERVTARHSGKVLDVTAQATGDGTLLEQWSSNNGANQQFTLVEKVPALLPD